jgi:hypothetical protein
VLLDSLDRTYAPKLWKIVFNQCRQQNQLIFGSISLNEYGNLCKQAQGCGASTVWFYTTLCTSLWTQLWFFAKGTNCYGDSGGVLRKLSCDTKNLDRCQLACERFPRIVGMQPKELSL